MEKILYDWLPTLLEHYENDEAAEWLNTPHEMLDGRIPLDLVRDGDQGPLVDLMEAMSRGVMA